MITKRGKPAAVVVPLEDAHKPYASERPSFADLLMAIPHSLEIERDSSPPRGADL
jgi:antitoxin Phd